MKARMSFKKFAALAALALLLSSAVFVSYDKHFEIARNIEIFANVYKEINAHYVDETDPSRLMKAGIDAMLQQLDPFTNYISEVQIENYRLVYEGKYNGMGVRAKKMGDYVTITEVYRGYPADVAGIRVGDQILAVNGLDGKGKESEDLFQIMRGMPRSSVVLTIARPGEQGSLQLTLERDEVNIPNVPYAGMVSDSVGYILLTTFTENAGKNVREAFKKLRSANPSLNAMILDLRDNGGGLLGEAVEVCNVFLPQGQLIATTRGKNKEKDQAYHTRQTAEDAQIPLVVLINGKSASASEIVSGTIQDLDRGLVVGQISYGKGLVQNTREVGYNAKVKLTIAKYYIPSGRCIQSVRYENGEPVHLPDSLRVPFKTRNGRRVYDGGGVKPDLELPAANHPEIVQQVLDRDYIFHYATAYCLKYSAPDSVRNFQFAEYPDFRDFLERKRFDDGSLLKQRIADLSTEASKEAPTSPLLPEIDKLKEMAQKRQWEALDRNAGLICDLIEEEIVGRTGYREAIIQKRMDHDPVILEASLLLADRTRYQRLLSGL
jgi:carboxyl-terminal processing protease